MADQLAIRDETENLFSEDSELPCHKSTKWPSPYQDIPAEKFSEREYQQWRY
jgi:hypothetical protein